MFWLTIGEHQIHGKHFYNRINKYFGPNCHLYSLHWQDDEVVLQCVATIQKEHRKFCLAAEGLGNRLCYLEPTSEAKVRKTINVIIDITITD